jgi:hypothetical protein
MSRPILVELFNTIKDDNKLYKNPHSSFHRELYHLLIPSFTDTNCKYETFEIPLWYFELLIKRQPISLLTDVILQLQQQANQQTANSCTPWHSYNEQSLTPPSPNNNTNNTNHNNNANIDDDHRMMDDLYELYESIYTFTQQIACKFL